LSGPDWHSSSVYLVQRQSLQLKDCGREKSGCTYKHLSDLEKLTQGIQRSLTDLNTSNAAIGETIVRAEGQRNEAVTQAPPGEAEMLAPVSATSSDSSDGTHDEAVLWERLRKSWEGARNSIENAANSPSLDGRTRASFLRVDRRTYDQLIQKMHNAGVIGANEEALELIRLRNKYRTRRTALLPADVDRAETLSRAVVSDLAGRSSLQREGEP
jgi:hypothetical protein